MLCTSTRPAYAVTMAGGRNQTRIHPAGDYRKGLWFNVPGRRGFVNITPEVEVALRESGIRQGFVLVNHNHITVSAFINVMNMACMRTRCGLGA